MADVDWIDEHVERHSLDGADEQRLRSYDGLDDSDLLLMWRSSVDRANQMREAVAVMDAKNALLGAVRDHRHGIER